jgi:hypothetical protein
MFNKPSNNGAIQNSSKHQSNEYYYCIKLKTVIGNRMKHHKILTVGTLIAIL